MTTSRKGTWCFTCGFKYFIPHNCGGSSYYPDPEMNTCGGGGGSDGGNNGGGSDGGNNGGGSAGGGSAGGGGCNCDLCKGRTFTYIGSSPTLRLSEEKKQELKIYVDSLIGCGCCTEFSPIRSGYLENAMAGLLEILEKSSNG